MKIQRIIFFQDKAHKNKCIKSDLKQKRCWHGGLLGNLRNKCRKFLNTRSKIPTYTKEVHHQALISHLTPEILVVLSPAIPRSRNQGAYQ